MVSPLPIQGPADAPITARRIAFVIYGLAGGGAERVVAALSGHLASHGHDVSVVTMASPRLDVYPLGEGVRRVALELANDSQNPLLNLLHVARRTVVFRRVLTALRPDVVVSFMPQTNVTCLVALAGTGVPVVVCERTDPRVAPLRRDWALLRRALYPRADAVVVQTASVASWARGFCPRVTHIPNFVQRPPRTASALADPGPKRLLAVGRLIDAKGFDLLIEAFARVANARPEWSLTILGEGPERARLEAAVKSRGLGGRVSLPGRVSDPFERLAEAHAFALSSRYEGFPNALLEAMACGLPVVSFDCPSGPGEVIQHRHNGLLVPAGDVGELARALGEVMDDAAARVQLGSNAARIAAALGPEAVLPLWTALLQRVAQGA